MPEVLLVTDGQHPRPLTPFGSGLAAALRASGDWVVHCCAAGAQEGRTGRTGLQAFQRLRHFLRTLAARVHQLPGAAAKVLVVLSGAPEWAGPLLRALAGTELRRRAVLVLHLSAERVPFAPECRDVFAGVDALVTPAAFITRAVQALYHETGCTPRCPVYTIRPALPAWAYNTIPDTQRQEYRRRLLGSADDATVLVGCWLDPPHERLGLALHTFRLLAEMAYWRCARCAAVNTYPLNLETLALGAPGRCQKCAHPTGDPARANPEMRFYLMNPAADPGSGSMNIDYREYFCLAERLGVDGGEERHWCRDPEAVRARFAALDILFCPYGGAAVPSPLLLASAAGVPAVAIKYGAVDEYFHAAMNLVPVESCQLQSQGHLQAYPDVAQATALLAELALSRSRRQVLGNLARDAVEECRWERVGPSWCALLGSLLASSHGGPRTSP